MELGRDRRCCNSSLSGEATVRLAKGVRALELSVDLHGRRVLAHVYVGSQLRELGLLEVEEDHGAALVVDRMTE